MKSYGGETIAKNNKKKKESHKAKYCVVAVA
jgi:hypothetical protein